MGLTSEELWFDSWQEQEIFIFLKCPDQKFILITQVCWKNIYIKKTELFKSAVPEMYPLLGESYTHFSKGNSLLVKMCKHVFVNKLFLYSTICTKMKILTVKTSQEGL